MAIYIKTQESSQASNSSTRNQDYKNKRYQGTTQNRSYAGRAHFHRASNILATRLSFAEEMAEEKYGISDGQPMLPNLASNVIWLRDHIENRRKRSAGYGFQEADSSVVVFPRNTARRDDFVVFQMR